MKKSTIVAFVALIMVFIYIFTAGNKFNVYEKEVVYKTPEEAIHKFMGFINVQEKVKGRDGVYSTETPKEFLESISERYRLYIRNGRNNRYLNLSVPSVKKLTIKEIKEDNDIYYIKTKYKESLREIKGYKNPSDIRFFRIEGEDYSHEYVNREDVNEDGTVNTEFNSENKYEEKPYITFDLVLIDEGEGYVVDFYENYN